MENFSEKHKSIIDNERIQEFIEDRKINPKDFFIIEKLATLDKQEIIGSFHNFFNLSAEKSAEDLKGIIERREAMTTDGESEAKDKEETLTIYKLFHEFCTEYGPLASQHLERILEEL